jgi:hypothetical protein
VPVALAQALPIRAARSEAELDALEAAYRIYDLYIWLSYRLEEGFPGRVAALRERAAVAALVEEALPRLLPDPAAVSQRCAALGFCARCWKCRLFLLCALCCEGRGASWGCWIAGCSPAPDGCVEASACRHPTAALPECSARHVGMRDMLVAMTGEGTRRRGGLMGA